LVGPRVYQQRPEAAEYFRGNANGEHLNPFSTRRSDMTIHEISNQLHHLSVDGFFNGEKFTKQELEHYIHNCFSKGLLKLENRLVMEIRLRDGEWLFTVDRFSNSTDGFDYYIPDTREQENHIWTLLTA
jgi:hypothetical protein